MPSDDRSSVGRSIGQPKLRTPRRVSTHPIVDRLSPTLQVLRQVYDSYGDGSPPDCSFEMSGNWVPDRELSRDERRHLSQFSTPRTVADGSLWWDLNEIPPIE